MRYVSTRGGMAPQSFRSILLEGLAPDGYSLRAVVERSGRALGSLTRPFRIRSSDEGTK